MQRGSRPPWQCGGSCKCCQGDVFAKWNFSISNEKEAVTAVINDTGRGTKEKTVDWTSEALRAVQEADSENKPILEWKEAFQEPTEG